MIETSVEKDWPVREVLSYPLVLGDNAKFFGCFPLYTMRGLAPTYYSKDLGGKYRNVTMNWFRGRVHPLRINYGEVFGRDDYTAENAWAVNQLFLGEEAWIFKAWMDIIYPEENTSIYPVIYPVKDIPIPIEIGVSSDGKIGSFHCFDGRWTHDWIISYWVDVHECELVSKEP